MLNILFIRYTKINEEDFKMKYKFKKLLKYLYWYIKEFILVSVFKQKDKEDRIVLVYTMGKVGSSTIFETIKKHDIKIKVFHIHFLSSQWLFNRLKKISYAKKNIRRGIKIRKYIEKNRNKRIKIISIVREPVSRNISDFFQNSKNEKINLNSLSTADIEELIINRGFGYGYEWFSDEFLNFTNFSVFENKFDKQKGYSIYNTQYFDILIIKLESLLNVYKKVFVEYMDIPVNKLIDINKGSQKEDADLINTIKTNFKMPRTFLEKIYTSEYVQHFYTKNEIETFVNKWSKK